MKTYIGEFYDLDAKLLQRRVYVAHSYEEADRMVVSDRPFPYGAVYYRVVEKQGR